ncbi:Dehydrogenase/reductase SDR family member 11 [Armadillidium vulgare]|nr:Dehydrogenase/reductase SDR family member 11 [Armadillidium vulgare]
MEKWKGRVALVTGASSGIGAAMCEDLVKHGMKVVGAARRKEKMQKASREVKKGKLVAMKCDLTKDEEVIAVFDQIKKQFNGVDVCINNAGFTNNKPLLSGQPSEWREMLDVNVVALCLVAKLAVLSMRERKVDDGHIVNICSKAGHSVSPLSEFHFYSSTKFAVKALTEGLRQELEELNSKIRVSQVSPGVAKTNFYSRFSDERMDELHKMLPPMEPENIVDAIIYLLSVPPSVEVRDIIVTGK